MHRLMTLALAGTALTMPALAQDAGEPGRRSPEFEMRGAINKPTQLPPDLAGLRVPRGYEVSIAASGLGNARIVAAAPDGTVYVTRRDEADVLMLRDADGDGTYESRRIVAARPNMHGIAIDGRTAWLITVNEIYSAPILADGSFGPLKRIVDDLPDGGQHLNRTIAIGGDGKLYVSAGSTCNACNESSQESATILQLSKDGKERKIFASGLRNTIGWDWNPRTAELWGFDHGIDWLGDEQQPEELNRIVEGKRYGWPYVWGTGEPNVQDVPPGGLTHADWKALSMPMVLGYAAHAAPMQMKFNRGTGFAADAQGDAFATMRGSWNRVEPSGYEVVRVRFGSDGQPRAIEPFLTGFLTRAPGGEAGWTGRPTGLDFAPDGSMLVGDSEHGVLYRIRYTGSDRPARPLGDAIIVRVREPGPIALQRRETEATARLQVRSSGFAAGGMVPRKYSAWYDNVSPPLEWNAGPAGTASYAVIVDDPDAASQKPVTHWLAWTLGPLATSLREGVPGQIQLKDPMLRQGAATNGRTGWYGMHPPVGDKPHRYHFQVFALDRVLDVAPGADRDTLLAAMQGHVLAKGETVGSYAQPRPPEQ